MAREPLPPDRLRTRSKVPSTVASLLEEQEEAWWFVDAGSEQFLSLHRVENVVYDRCTRHRRVQVVDLEESGRSLILDGRVQLASADEHIYHEMFVHPAMVWGQFSRVLVLGGGDGCLLRELLKWDCVERVVLVTADDKVVEATRKLCPSWSDGAFGDPRVELLHQSFLDVLENDERFDLVLANFDNSDLADKLTPDFCWNVKEKLAPGGLFAAQTGGFRLGASSLNAHHSQHVNDIREAFEEVRVAYEYIPSLQAVWTVTFASPTGFEALENDDLEEMWFNSQHAVELIDQVLEEEEIETGYYDGMSHVRLFTPPVDEQDLYGWPEEDDD